MNMVKIAEFILTQNPDALQDFESRLKPYSIDAVCDAMLREASRALRAHDLAEAHFWQDGYLSIRPIVKTETELIRYLRHEEAVRV